MSETITHVCTISWGMLVGENIGEYIDGLIKKKKLEVALALERCGFMIKDQHFIHEVEWGTLYTWAELVENPENTTIYIGKRKCKIGSFYKDQKIRGL